METKPEKMREWLTPQHLCAYPDAHVVVSQLPSMVKVYLYTNLATSSRIQRRKPKKR